MSRSILRLSALLLVVFAVGCATPTDPSPARARVAAPGGAAFDATSPVDSTAADSTCRSGYNVGQGLTC